VAGTVATATGLELETSRGVTHIADEVVAKLAGHACREIGGVAGMGATFRRRWGICWVAGCTPVGCCSRPERHPRSSRGGQ